PTRRLYKARGGACGPSPRSREDGPEESAAVRDDDRRDDAGGDGGEHVLAVRFTPGIAVRRAAKVMLAIVDRRGAAPVVVTDAVAVAPRVVGIPVVLTPPVVSPVVAGLIAAVVLGLI